MRSIGRVAEVTKPQPTTFLKTQSFAVQLIIHFWVALHGCIDFPAIRQTLTVRKMLHVLARANTPETIGNKPDE